MKQAAEITGRKIVVLPSDKPLFSGAVNSKSLFSVSKERDNSDLNKEEKELYEIAEMAELPDHCTC